MAEMGQSKSVPWVKIASAPTLCLGKAGLDRRVTLDFAGKAAKILQGL